MFYYFCSNRVVSIKMNININDLYIKLERAQLENIWIQIWALITECAADLLESVKRRNYKVLWAVQANILKRSHFFSYIMLSAFLMICRGWRCSSYFTLSPAILPLIRFPEAMTGKSDSTRHISVYVMDKTNVCGQFSVTSRYRNRSFHMKTIKFADVISGGIFWSQRAITYFNRIRCK